MLALMKFLCDEMLKGVARWLRAAGYDAVVGPDGTRDADLLAQALEENRIFLTRDKRLVEEHPPSDHLVLLDCNEEAACLQELRNKLGVDWLHRPFTRCLKCNTPLVEADPDKWQLIPAQSRELATRLLYCPHCAQLFWDGGHVSRMRAQLHKANTAPVAGRATLRDEDDQ